MPIIATQVANYWSCMYSVKCVIDKNRIHKITCFGSWNITDEILPGTKAIYLYKALPATVEIASVK